MALAKNTNLTSKIIKVYYALSENVASVLKTSTDLTKQVTFNVGQDWNELYFTAGTAKFSEPMQEDRSGKIYDQTLQLNYPGEDEANAITLYNITARKIIVRLDYNTGMHKIMGDLERPARLTPNHTSDVATRSNLQIKCMGIKPAHFLYIP